MNNKFVLYREALERFRQTIMRNGGPENPLIYPSYIRMEASIATTQLFNFFPNNNTNGSNTSTSTENRLDMNDAFQICEQGLFVGVAAAGADEWKLYTYPNAAVFPTSTSAAAINGMYDNGIFSMLKNNVQYLNNWDLLRHRKVQTIQDGASFGYNTATSAALPNVMDNFDGVDDGFYPYTPFLFFTGKDNMQVQIQKPTAMTAITANSRFVIIWRGFTAANCAQYLEKKF